MNPMQAKQPTPEKKKWPLASLTPDTPDGPEAGDDALNALAGFAARIQIEAPYCPVAHTEKRLRVLKETADWILATGYRDFTPRSDTSETPSTPGVVRYAQMIFGPATITREDQQR